MSNDKAGPQARLILVASGEQPFWQFFYPTLVWHALTPNEQAAVISRQKRLMEKLTHAQPR